MVAEVFSGTIFGQLLMNVLFLAASLYQLELVGIRFNPFRMTQ